MNMESNVIRLYSETGNVNDVVSQLRSLVKTYGDRLKFNLAEIETLNPSEISPDIGSDAHYPLRLFSKLNKMTVMISEVRTGYCGESVDAMFECLNIANFKLSTAAVNSIRNQRVLRLKIWKEGVKQF